MWNAGWITLGADYWIAIAEQVREIIRDPAKMAWILERVKAWAAKPVEFYPLPVPERPLSMEEKCAGLAAIHDWYMKGEKINPWIEGSDADVWARYKSLMDRVAILPDCDERFIRGWVRDVREAIDRGGLDVAELKPAVKVAHSTDFRSVTWFGTCYFFTENQAKVVALLFKNWENGTPDVGDTTLLDGVDHEAPPARLNVLFRDSPAWRTMIVAGKTQATHRLQSPNS